MLGRNKMIDNSVVKIIVVILLPVFFLIDQMTIRKALKQKLKINNWYTRIHSKLGADKTTLLKIAFLTFIAFSVYRPSIRRSDPYLAAGFYFLIVIIQLVQFISSSQKQLKNYPTNQRT